MALTSRMQAEYEMRVQAIRSKGPATRLFVNVPLPLGAARTCRRENACAGNFWLLPSCASFVSGRPRPKHRKSRQRFFSRIQKRGLTRCLIRPFFDAFPQTTTVG